MEVPSDDSKWPEAELGRVPNQSVVKAMIRLPRL
jgi:hypothetical protein